MKQIIFEIITGGIILWGLYRWEKDLKKDVKKLIHEVLDER